MTTTKRSSSAKQLSVFSNCITMCLACLAALATQCCLVPQVSAAPVSFTSNASGAWNVAGTWTSLPGDHFYPISGDDVTFTSTHAISVSAPEQFGDNTGTNNSFISNTANNGNLLALNSNLTHVAGSTLIFNGTGYVIMTGTNGTLINNGIVENANDSTRIWYWRGNNQNFENNNELRFTNGGRWQMDQGSPTLNNTASGLVTANTATATIFGNSATRSIFNQGIIQADGTTLQIQAKLNDAGGTIQAINGGTVRFNSTGTGGGHTTVAGTIFNAAAGGDTIRLGGRIDSLEGTISGAGVVQFQEPVSAGQALSYFDFGATEIVMKGTNGGSNWTWSGADAGNVMEARSLMRHDGSGGYNLFQIDGTFRNVAGNTVTLDNGSSFYFRGTGAGATFENLGTLDFVGSTAFRLDQGTTSLNNPVGGLILASSGGTGGTIVGNAVDRVINNSSIIRADGATLQIQARLNDLGGTIQAINGGTVRFNGTGTGGGHTSLAITNFNAAAVGDTIRLGGRIDSLEGTISGAGAVQFQEPVSAGQALSYFDFGATEIVMKGTNGGSNWTWSGADAGNVLEARSPMRHDGSTGYNLFQIDGTFRNVAGNTITLDNGSTFYFRGTGSGATFENLGTLNMVSTTNINLDQGTTTLLNKGDINVTSLSADIVGNAATRTFDNQGTVTVDGTAVNSTLTVSSATNLPQFDGVDTLTGGTWRVIADGVNTATLNLDPAPNGSITTLAAGASVVLSEASASSTANFPELGTIDTIAGSLYVHGFSSLALGASTSVSGSLGGDGTVSASNITFTGGTLDPSALNGDPGTLNLVGDLILDDTTQLTFSLGPGGIIGGGVNDLVNVIGDLTLDGVLDVTTLPGFGTGGDYRLFNYTGTLTYNELVLFNPQYRIDTSILGQVNLFLIPVPEPSTGLLLLLGLVGLRRRVRRQG